MTQNIVNTLYEMDNLEVLRGINSNSIDLIATDPPFNTKRNRSDTAGFYVDKWRYGDTGKLPDQWKWNEVHPKWLETIQDSNPELYQAIEATRLVRDEDTAAFLCFLSVRLLEMHRILRDTGSIYLHCDHTVNAYIRMALDAIFGEKSFRNEIVWHYRRWTAASKRFQRMHDNIFYYTKSDDYTFTKPLQEYADEKYIEDTVRGFVDGKLVRLKDNKGDYIKRKTQKGGVLMHDVWHDINFIGPTANERIGSPDQKPLALYERIIKASSKEGDIVLDPFCGCATTIVAAKNLKRKWIGIDRREDARWHIITRFMGVSKEERERLEKLAMDEKWLEEHIQKYEMHYQTEPPERTDNQETAAEELPPVLDTDENFQMTRQEIHNELIKQFGFKCWGCNFEAPDPRYLELDHIEPQSESGSNHIHNRALLCKPCNLEKSDRMTLQGLRSHNKQSGYMKEGEPINLKKAREWTWNFLLQRIRETPYQMRLEM